MCTSDTAAEGPLTFESFSNKVVAPYCVDALCVPHICMYVYVCIYIYIYIYK